MSPADPAGQQERTMSAAEATHSEHTADEGPPHGDPDRTQAVVTALIELGEKADPQQVSAHVRAATGLDLSPNEIETIRRRLLEKSRTAPGPDRPPPEAAAGGGHQAAG
jgi:hypothetical protein